MALAILRNEARPVIITQNEYMRRMKEMSKFQAGMGFYGQMPDYAKTNDIVHQLIDLALLQNGMLEKIKK